MTDEFDKTLRRALRPMSPGEGFADRVSSRLQSADPATGAASGPADRGGAPRHRVLHSRWLPAALAACILAGIGLVHLREQAVDAARARQAREQLLQALSIARDNINIVRGVVARAEDPDS